MNDEYRTPREVLERQYRRLIARADAFGIGLPEAVAGIESADARDEMRRYIASTYDVLV